jgi:hypothetical protein
VTAYLKRGLSLRNLTTSVMEKNKMDTDPMDYKPTENSQTTRTIWFSIGVLAHIVFVALIALHSVSSGSDVPSRAEVGAEDAFRMDNGFKVVELCGIPPGNEENAE